MGRSPASSPEHVSVDATSATASAFRSIRDRFPFKRYNSVSSTTTLPRSSKTTALTHKAPRSHHHNRRRLPLLAFVGKSWFFLCVLIVVFTFALASMVLQRAIMPGFRQGVDREARRWRWSVKEELKVGSTLDFVPCWSLEMNGSQLDWQRSQPRIGVRRPRICLILGSMEKDISSLMVYSVMKNFRDLGYLLKIFALEDGEARSFWQGIAERVSILSLDEYGFIDWSTFEGIVVDSIEAKDAISSLMQEPFCSIPLVWIIQEDILANRLSLYEKRGWNHLISNWKKSFSRADAIVFPDFSFPMLYSMLDTGNFLVIPGSPVDAWVAERYAKTHSKSLLRKEYGFEDDDLLVLVFGSSVLFDELAWDYAIAIRSLEPLLVKYTQSDAGLTFKFMFLCGNSNKYYDDSLKDFATRLRLNQRSLKHYGIENDVNGLTLMADIVLYASSQDEQGFPPILTRAMIFGIPVIAADYPIIRKYVTDGVHGITYAKGDPEALINAFSLLISEGELSRLAHSIASDGMIHAKNMLAMDCIIGYANLMERVLDFPSYVSLPSHASEVNNTLWEWGLLSEEHDVTSLGRKSSIVSKLEDDLVSYVSPKLTQGGPVHIKDMLTNADWNTLNEIESSEEVERLKWEEIDERMEKDLGNWDDIYRNARKSEKIRFEVNERDEGELERTGQMICIYEIYSGQGGWPFLHHGSMYRGLSLSPSELRLSADDVDAVGRLPILNDTYYRDILCEIGGMFSIANGIDDIHKRPWIGFQSWLAGGRKLSLSQKAEEALEKVIKENVKGDVIYYWATLDMVIGSARTNNLLTFWSTCDIINAGRCRTTFENAFRRMYGLPSTAEALPPMPQGGGHWMALHSWAIPTPSFLEFIMFSRMFVDSLHSIQINSSKNQDCLLGFSSSEKRHCYCRLSELLVNVWAYHSARKMVYIDPHSGLLKEQHHVERRRGFMWAEYFNLTLLKSMDEDLAEAADDGDHPYTPWLWPSTGKVYWQGLYEREREERYRVKMDKKRTVKMKLFDRLKHGYKQKSLAG